MKAYIDKKHSFEKAHKLGDEGETIIHEWLKHNYKEVKDVTGDEEYRKKDIDYIVTTESGEKVSIEVKTDSYISPNIFYEVISNKERNIKGCMVSTESDFIIYYFIKENIAYIMETDSLKIWVLDNYKRFKVHGFEGEQAGGGVKTTIGLLIPKKTLEEAHKNKLITCVKTKVVY